MKKVSIVGFGRFGKTLYRLFKDDFEIVLYNRSGIDEKDLKLTPKTRITSDLKQVYESDVIFYAVTISQFETVIKEHKKYFEPRHVLIDVLSVKMHPAKVFKDQLKGLKTRAILTHPMFGPDSSLQGFNGLPIVIDKFMADDATYGFWKDYFIRKKLDVIELTAEEHDKKAANSQGLTHFVGRLLEEYGIEESPIDTIGTSKLVEIKRQTANDTWQLFNDLQHYNPYTKDMRLKLGAAYDKVYTRLLPKQVDADKMTIGIQGGKGSFNEEAVQYWLNRAGITEYDVKYLFTTENVLAALHSGEIDRGLFAIHNSVGGIVDESVQAMASYKFKIVEEFGIKIAHALMIRSDAKYDEIKSIMSHPQVFAQCKSTLAQKYPHLKQTSGVGELIDHANVAKQLSSHKLPKETATMGSKILSEIYGLKIVEENLQDAQDNYTSFLLVSR